MTTPAQKRLLKDLKSMEQDPPEGITGAPVDNDILRWNAVIFGPDGTPFADGVFKLTMTFSEDYPNRAPRVKFVSRIFHPNVYADGSICLDILQQKWSPTYNIVGILTSIQSLLDEPNPNSPANAVAAKLFCENKREYERRVRECVEESWNDVSDDDDDEDEEDEEGQGPSGAAGGDDAMDSTGAGAAAAGDESKTEGSATGSLAAGGASEDAVMTEARA